MRFAALQPFSMVNWPGRLAAVAFTTGCNLRCRYCHNPALATGRAEAGITEEAVIAHLRRRRGQLDGLVVTGGEPTLQPGLGAFLARVRQEGFRVKLDTNGTRPALVGALLDAGLVDFLALDLKTAPGAGAWLTGCPGQAEAARRCLRLALAAGVDHELRTTLVAPVHDPAALRAMAEVARGARRWAFQPFRPGGHLDQEAPLSVPDRSWVEAAGAAARLVGVEPVLR